MPVWVVVRPLVEVIADRRLDDVDVSATRDEMMGEALAGGASGGVGVHDGDDGQVVTTGVVSDSVGGVFVGGVAAEHGDCSVSGLGGGESVGDALAHDEHTGPQGRRRGGNACPRDAGVGSESGGRVVVLGAFTGVEVASLDVGDGTACVVRGERGRRAGPLR